MSNFRDALLSAPKVKQRLKLDAMRLSILSGLMAGLTAAHNIHERAVSKTVLSHYMVCQSHDQSHQV